MGMKRPSKNDFYKTKRSKSYLTISTNDSEPKNLLDNVQDVNNDFDQQKIHKIFSENRNEMYLLKFAIESVLKELKSITQKLRDDQLEEEESLDWKFAAMVIDRICMYFFAIATFFSTSIILLTSPNLYRSSDPDPIF
jgi:nicotinic acetylcholine receptor, invertebrate